MRHFRRWGAVWILVGLFLASWLGQFFAQVAQVRAEAQTHGERFLWSDFWPEFFAATAENWQSEFLQLAFQTVLVASLWGQRRFFNADAAADKDDVARIVAEIQSLKPTPPASR